MRKLLFTVAAACMSFAAMAQHTVNPQAQRMDPRTVSMPSQNSIMAPATSAWLDPVTYFTRDCLFDAPDGQANAYAFMIFDYRYRTNSFVHFTTNAVNDYAMMADYMQVPAQSLGFFCSTFVGEKIFAYAYNFYGPGALVPVSMGYINPKTGIYEEATKLPQGSSTVLSDMSYDPQTKLIYATEMLYSEQKCIGTQIYTIDPTDPKLTLKAVAKVNYELYTLAADKGVLYAIAPIKGLDGLTNKNSLLLKMPTSSIKNGQVEVEELNKKAGLGINIGYAQTMEFDKVNHKLWWLAQTLDDKSYLAEVDVETGKIAARQEFSYTAQAVALAIPSQDVNATAPSYVRNLQAKAAEGGAGTISFSWTNPDVNFNLDALTSLKSIKIIRDGELVKTIDAAAIGQAQTYEDTNVPSGVHIYRIQTVNENGDGAYKEVKTFVGHDVPAGVSGIKVKADGCKATISWSAPTIGVNGGWIDQTSLKYDVVRFPGEVKIASDITECQVTDEVTTSEGYYYEITAKNNDGEGATVKSEVTVFGPTQTVPFFTTLATESEFNKWSVIDNNNDLISWKYDKTFNVTCYERAVGPADDYLVSPAINFEAGKKYQIRFKYWTINWVNPADHSPIYDKMDIYYAQEPTAAAFQKAGSIRDLGEFHTPSETYLYAKQVFTAQPGEGYLAFHAYSDPDRSIIYVQDVCVREYSATDLSITDFKGSIAAVQGTQSAYGVEVMNEGSAKVENYTVDLINKATGEVLASANGVALDPEQKKMVTVEWAPATVGEMEVTARVNLEGDTYADDNTWKESINVTVEPSGSANWLSVNEDDAYVDEGGNWMNKGYAMPFNCGTAYSMVQCIYLDKEITKKNITITGIQFIYDGNADGDYEKDIKVSAMAADKDFFGWNQEDLMVESYDYEDENWMPLYEGKFKFSGITKDQKLTIDFDNWYYYEGGNLVFMFEKLWDDMYFCNNDAPAFHYHDIYDDGEDLRQRTCKFASKYTEYPDPDKIGTMSFVPFTLFQYMDGDQTGIMGVTSEGLNFDIFNGTLTMSEVCGTIAVYDLDGKMVAEAHNTNTIAVSNGTYVVKAVAGNKTVNCKVSVK